YLSRSRPRPRGLEAIARLAKAGYRLVVATIQSGIARKLFDVATLGAVHSKMHRAVADAGGRIDAIFFCPHGPDEGCACRKPQPGLFEEILARFYANAAEVHAIGAQLRDLQAAHAAGCRPIAVPTGKAAAPLAARGPRLIVHAARRLVGIDWRVLGAEHLPDEPAIVLSKHQSTWETLFYPIWMPRELCYVFKRELLWLPFFGWGIGLLDMIHIDRSR